MELIFTPSTSSDVLSRAAAFPYMDRLTEQGWRRLDDGIQSVDLAAGQLLLREGSDCEAFLLVERGGIRVYRQSPSGREITLYRVEPGESCVLGTSCLLGGQQYPALAVAHEATGALAISATIFRQLFAEEPAVQAFVMDLFARRMASLMLLVGEVSFGRMDQRLATFLIKQAEKRPGEFSPIQLSHEEIALHLGTAREVISRLLQQFAEGGAIELSRRQVTIRNPDVLRSSSLSSG